MTGPSPFTERLVLIVDDDAHTRMLLRDLCDAAGFRVQTAADGVEALEQIGREKPDLLLLDLMMPRKDGFGVLKGLRETEAMDDLPVIVLTAMGDMDGKIRAMELGADDFVTKPFKLIELQTRINSTFLVRDYRKRLVAAEEELAPLRAVDPVTGAGTYSQLKASLDGELSRTRRFGRPTAALVVGCEDYSKVRFQLGRERCDAFVAKLAQAIRGSLRGADRLFRLDDDQFVVLLPETALAGAHQAAERLAQLAKPLSQEAGVASLCLRIGGAAFPSERVQSSEDLLREANRVYAASGKATSGGGAGAPETPAAS